MYVCMYIWIHEEDLLLRNPRCSAISFFTHIYIYICIYICICICVYIYICICIRNPRCSALCNDRGEVQQLQQMCNSFNRLGAPRSATAEELKKLFRMLTGSNVCSVWQLLATTSIRQHTSAYSDVCSVWQLQATTKSSVFRALQQQRSSTSLTRRWLSCGTLVLSLLALLVQKYES